MRKQKTFRFEKARRVSRKETLSFKKGIENKLGLKRPLRGRPPKPVSERFAAISIRLHPQARTRGCNLVEIDCIPLFLPGPKAKEKRKA